jgi:hypothetical protein
MYKNQWKACLHILLLGGAIAGAGPLQAHHSNVMFDNSTEVALTGTVKEFQWGNPHCYIQVVVTAEDGSTQEWSVEMAAPMYLYGLGWRPTTLKAGDTISTTVWPLRSGEPGGLARTVLDAEGKRIGREP